MLPKAFLRIKCKSTAVPSPKRFGTAVLLFYWSCSERLSPASDRRPSPSPACARSRRTQCSAQQAAQSRSAQTRIQRAVFFCSSLKISVFFYPPSINHLNLMSILFSARYRFILSYIIIIAAVIINYLIFTGIDHSQSSGCNLVNLIQINGLIQAFFQ